MLSTDRKFHLKGELNINKSKLLKGILAPKDDNTNWLFLILNNIEYSFVYKIEKPDNAEYNTPFKILLAFTVFDLIKNDIELNQIYTVMRGQEKIGTVKLYEFL